MLLPYSVDVNKAVHIEAVVFVGEHSLCIEMMSNKTKNLINSQFIESEAVVIWLNSR